MDQDQVLLSDELLAVCRAAVTYAVEYGATFVAPPHMLLALLDDNKIGDALAEGLERGRIVAAARQPAPGGVHEVGEGVMPRGEKPPFLRYDSLVFHSSDGQYQRWLNRDSFKLFNESAKRANGGRFLPRHLALGLTVVAQDDQNVRSLLGKEPETFKEIVYALK
jgi:Clp amino terminal domain, pathogenicity island component